MNKIVERTNKQINKDRRKFLDMLGKAGVSTSILKASTLAGGIFASRFAEAQDDNKKIIFVYLPDGAPTGTWLPSGGQMNQCTQPYGPHASNIAFRQANLTYGGGHGNTFFCMGATSYNPSDAKSSSLNFQMSKVIGNLTPYASIQLGALSAQGSASDSICKLNGQSVVNEDSPRAAFQQLFNSAPPAPVGGGPSPYDQERSVLDVNKQAISSLRTKLGVDERSRLDQHLESLARIESRVTLLEDQQSNTGDNGGACTPPGIGTDGYMLALLKSQADVATAALKCGLTRVASIQANYHQASWVGTGSGTDSTTWGSDHHQSCHGGPTSANVEMVRYLSKGVAYLIGRLKAEGLLESTMVVQVTDMGNGQDHSAANGPFLIASGMPGFKAGAGTAGGNEAILADAVNGMGLSSSVGGKIGNYGNGAGIF